MARRSGFLGREWWHLHSRSPGEVVPRPVLVKVTQLEVHQHLVKHHGTRLTREAWGNVNSDRPAWVLPDGTTFYLFTTMEHY